jgi:hypothetical protein
MHFNNFVISGHPGERQYIMDLCQITYLDSDCAAINKIYKKLAEIEIELRQFKDMEEKNCNSSKYLSQPESS